MITNGLALTAQLSNTRTSNTRTSDTRTSIWKQHPSRPRHALRLVAPIVLATAALQVGSTPPAAACSSYSIDGGIDQPVPDSYASGSAAVIEVTATAFVHDGGEPLANHVVWASFTMGEGFAPVEPLLAVTDIDGRVSVTLPVGATGVVFRTEAPPSSGCVDPGAPGSPVVPDGVVPESAVPVDPSEPEVVTVEVPAIVGASDRPTSVPVDPVGATTLPRTGPGARGFLLGGLALAGGIGLVLGRRRPVVPG